MDKQEERYLYCKETVALAEIQKVHDRLHLKNYNNINCRIGAFNPDCHDDLKAVKTEVAEQFFSYLLNFVQLFKNATPKTVKIWMLLIVNHWNLKKMVKINNSVSTAE